MTELVLRNGNPAIIPRIKLAIHNELKLIELGIMRTKENIAQLETKYHLNSENFLNKIKRDELSDDNLDFIDWQGEIQLLKKLHQEYNDLKEVVLCE